MIRNLPIVLRNVYSVPDLVLNVLSGTRLYEKKASITIAKGRCSFHLMEKQLIAELGFFGRKRGTILGSFTAPKLSGAKQKVLYRSRELYVQRHTTQNQMYNKISKGSFKYECY